MAKRTRVRDYDQFIVRLPPGMRDRIKAKAERAGMSMNEAIVYVLEKAFPAPATLEDKINQLATMVAALKNGNDLEEKVDGIIDEIAETLRAVDDNKVEVSTDFRSKVQQRLEEWSMDAIESAVDPLDDGSWGYLGNDGSTEPEEPDFDVFDDDKKP